MHDEYLKLIRQIVASDGRKYTAGNIDRSRYDRLVDLGPRLVAIDSVAAVFDGEAIARRQVRAFLAMLRKIARQHDVAIALGEIAMHLSKHLVTLIEPQTSLMNLAFPLPDRGLALVERGRPRGEFSVCFFGPGDFSRETVIGASSLALFPIGGHPSSHPSIGLQFDDAP
jgi:hypothetical protein